MCHLIFQLEYNHVIFEMDKNVFYWEYVYFTCVIFEDLAEIIDSAASVAHIFSFFIVLLHP